MRRSWPTLDMPEWARRMYFELRRESEPGPWIPFPFASGWVNYGAGYGECAYRKAGDVVQLRGLMNRSGGAFGTSSVVGTLPLGFRPPTRTIFNQRSSVSAGTAVRVDVFANGDVVLAPSGGTSDWLSLDGIEFFTSEP